MAKFTDDEKRDWLIRVDVNAIKKVRELFEINLGNIEEAGKCLAGLADDPETLCNLLYALCEEQVKARNLTDADFGRLFLGDTIDRATMALGEAVTDFFPPRLRSRWQRLQKKIERTKQAGEELIGKKLDDPELDKRLAVALEARMDKQIEESLTLFASVSSSPAKSEESTPAP